MSRQGSGGGAKRGGGRSGKPGGASWQPSRSPRSASSTGLTAGIFAKMRQGLDVVAFGSSVGASVAVSVYEESVETFQQRRVQPRSFVLILSRGLEASDFEAFQASFRIIEPLIQKAVLVSGERPYWKLNFSRSGRRLSASDGTTAELQKVEKR